MRSILLRWAHRIMRRPPDFTIGGAERPYMHRWFVIPRNRLFNIYLHRIVRSDDDRALHDHPWANCSLLLDGSYFEWLPRRHPYKFGDAVVLRRRGAGSLVFRRARSAHRLELAEGAAVISLFVTGPRVRVWGFFGPQGWVPWQQFTDPDDPGRYRESAR